MRALIVTWCLLVFAGAAQAQPVLGFPGDTNQDGLVDAVDYIALKANMGRMYEASVADGDFNYDRNVDWADLAILRLNYGRRVGDPSRPVPEPLTCALLALGGAALLRRRRWVRCQE